MTYIAFMMISRLKITNTLQVDVSFNTNLEKICCKEENMQK